MSASNITSPSFRHSSERSATCSGALGRPHFYQCSTILVKIFLSPRFRCLPVQAPFLRKILPEASPRCPSAGDGEPLRSPALLASVTSFAPSYRSSDTVLLERPSPRGPVSNPGSTNSAAYPATGKNFDHRSVSPKPCDRRCYQ